MNPPLKTLDRLLLQETLKQPKTGFYGSAVGYAVDEGNWIRGQGFGSFKPGATTDQPSVGSVGGNGLVLFRSQKSASRSVDGPVVKVKITVEILEVLET